MNKMIFNQVNYNKYYFIIILSIIYLYIKTFTIYILLYTIYILLYINFILYLNCLEKKKLKKIEKMNTLCNSNSNNKLSLMYQRIVKDGDIPLTLNIFPKNFIKKGNWYRRDGIIGYKVS